MNQSTVIKMINRIDQVRAIPPSELDKYFIETKNEIYLNFKKEILKNSEFLLQYDIPHRDCKLPFDKKPPEIHEIVDVFLGNTTNKVQNVIQSLDLSYFTGEYVYINKSPIHNLGLFAKQKIFKNTMVHSIVVNWGLWNHSFEPNCEVVNDDNTIQALKVWDKLSDRERSDKIDKFYPRKNRANSLKIWGTLSDRERSRYIVAITNSTGWNLNTLRNIEKNEELLIDYTVNTEPNPHWWGHHE